MQNVRSLKNLLLKFFSKNFFAFFLFGFQNELTTETVLMGLIVSDFVFGRLLLITLLLLQFLLQV